MTSADFRAIADHIEKLCIVACGKRQISIACSTCKNMADRLRAHAAELDSVDPKTRAGRAKQRTLQHEGGGDAGEILDAREAKAGA